MVPPFTRQHGTADIPGGVSFTARKPKLDVQNREGLRRTCGNSLDEPPKSLFSKHLQFGKQYVANATFVYCCTKSAHCVRRCAKKRVGQSRPSGSEDGILLVSLPPKEGRYLDSLLIFGQSLRIFRTAQRRLLTGRLRRRLVCHRPRHTIDQGVDPKARAL